MLNVAAAMVTGQLEGKKVNIPADMFKCLRRVNIRLSFGKVKAVCDLIKKIQVTMVKVLNRFWKAALFGVTHPLRTTRWAQTPVISRVVTPFIGGEITPVTHLFSAIYRVFSTTLITIGLGPTLSSPGKVVHRSCHP